jgi:hypothetical protein
VGIWLFPNLRLHNVDFSTVADGIKLSEAALRRLRQRWLCAGSGESRLRSRISHR